MLAAIGVAVLGGIAVATNAQADPQPKAWVCKYVGTPYVNETLKTGNDGLVWVDTGTTQGSYFGDSQNDSYVLLVGPHDPKPDASGCPAPRILTQPVFTPPTCDSQGSVLAIDTDYYTWSHEGPLTAVVYTATHVTKQGVVEVLFVSDPYNLAKLTGDACVIKVLPPVYVPPTCTAIGTLSVPTPVGYSWRIVDGIYTAVVDDDNYTLTGAGPFGPFPLAQLTGAQCTTTLLNTVAALTFTPGTCLAVGSVVATETSSYAWIVSGPGTARSYQAVAKSGFTLTGTTAFGPFDLSQLPSDSAACVAPKVLGVVKNAPVVAGVVKNAPVVAGVVKNAPAVKSLAFTGAETVPLGLSGLLTLVLGAVLTVASRRQRPKQARE